MYALCFSVCSVIFLLGSEFVYYIKYIKYDFTVTWESEFRPSLWFTISSNKISFLRV